jgi:acetyl-CoA carboxylase carboxyl transferase subunit alpha
MDDYFEFEKPVADIEKTIEQLRSLSPAKGNMVLEIVELEKKCLAMRKDIYAHLTPWQMVQIARHPRRPVLQDYISMIFTDFVELHGDRRFSDDEALIGGFATIGKQRVMLIGHNKGKNIEENIRRNFAQPKPEGYRKALRLMKLAEKYGLPVVSFVDTQGAYPGLDAEERGQAEAIARNLTEMARLEVPIVVLVTGEGGSGGALGIAVGDSVLMMSYAVYSVISPEGCASILWRDAAFSPQAAEALKITAPSLLELGVIDEIVPEPLGGAHRKPEEAATAIKAAVLAHLKKLKSYSTARLLHKRFAKYSGMGKFNTK